MAVGETAAERTDVLGISASQRAMLTAVANGREVGLQSCRRE
jgi:hypothetical protein